MNVLDFTPLTNRIHVRYIFLLSYLSSEEQVDSTSGSLGFWFMLSTFKLPICQSFILFPWWLFFFFLQIKCRDIIVGFTTNEISFITAYGLEKLVIYCSLQICCIIPQFLLVVFSISIKSCMTAPWGLIN